MFDALLRKGQKLQCLNVCLLCCSIANGCVSANYSAANLPHEFVAQPLTSARHLDLSALSHHKRPAEVLQAGDSVDLTIATGIETSQPTKWNLRVSDEGQLDIPLVGPVQVIDLSPREAEALIREESIRRGLYVAPKITLQIALRRSYRVTVAGAVKEPGTYDIPVSDCDVLAAITVAKGLEEDAATVVEIRHPSLPNQFVSGMSMGNEVVPASGGIPTQAERLEIEISRANEINPEKLRLRDGSVVMVSRQPKRVVNVMGLVRSPAQIPIPPGEELMLLDAIAQAGGTTISFADKVQIVRRVPNYPQPVVIGASLREARNGMADNIRLAPGDLVSVEETPTTLVVDTIRTFFRVGFAANIPGI
jgi:polysaccharide export outer membrane protein